MNRMNLKKICTVAFLFLVLMSVSGCGTGENVNQNNENVLKEGDIAPEFTAQLADGSTFTLSDGKGKVVLLNFWATWCGPCVGEMPAFEKLHKEYGDDVAILAVNYMEDASTVDRFIDENGYTFPIAYDEDGTINMKYPSDGIPYTVILDKEGVIQYIYLGAEDADTQYQEYKSAIDDLLDQ